MLLTLKQYRYTITVHGSPTRTLLARKGVEEEDRVKPNRNKTICYEYRGAGMWTTTTITLARARDILSISVPVRAM